MNRVEGGGRGRERSDGLTNTHTNRFKMTLDEDSSKKLTSDSSGGGCRHRNSHDNQSEWGAANDTDSGGGGGYNGDTGEAHPTPAKESDPLQPKAVKANKERSMVVSLSSEPEREHWNQKVEFLLAVIGFAVDLGNVWRYVEHRNEKTDCQ